MHSYATLTTHGADLRQLILDLHRFLNDLEPARFKAEREAHLRERFDELHARFDAAARHYAESADQRARAWRDRFEEMSAVIAAHREHFALRRGVTLEETREAWAAFRASAEPAYEALVASMKSDDIVLPSLRPTNYTRNLFHVASALLGVLFAELLPGATSLGFTLVIAIAVSCAVLGWSMELGRRMSERVNAGLMWAFSPVSHPHEAHHVNSATWYVTSLALLSLTFNPLVCGVALTILGFADPAAAVIGKRFGKHRLENGRSIEGTVAFVLIGAVTATLTIALFHPEMARAHAVLIATAGALAGGLTELFSKRLDDNLGIPLSSGAAAWAVWLLLGFLELA